ncbi:hypothetical protein ACTWQL_24080 [Pseudalkalibacillus sp. R45]|uniref:hypothetical protein n=1 Tax=Pseudalkalibacillus sp. R45 TaxID=3457433 RepID=UPI003FCC2AC5
MPCEEIIQVVGMLTPQDKESFGSVTSLEENQTLLDIPLPFKQKRLIAHNCGEPGIYYLFSSLLFSDV